MHRISTRTAALSAAAVLVTLLCGSGASAVPDTDAAVRALWATLDARWNERDAARFSEVFTNDVSFEFVDRGESLETRAVVREYFGARFPNFAPELQHLTTVRDVTTLSPDVLAVDGKVEILRDNPGGTAKPALLRTYAIFAVMMREAEGWKIRMVRIFQLPEAEASAARPAPTRPTNS